MTETNEPSLSGTIQTSDKTSNAEHAGTFKTITKKTTFWLSKVKHHELVQLIQEQEADGWKYVGNFPTIRGVRPRHFHTLLFRKD